MNLDLVRAALATSLMAAAERGGGEIPVSQDLFHIVGTVNLAVLLAEHRGVDRDLAEAAMLLHDIGRLDTGSIAGHNLRSAEIAPAILSQAGFTDEQIAQIRQAIATHSNKLETGNPLEELVRDADVLDGYLRGRPITPAAERRVAALQAELGLRRQGTAQ